MTPQQYVLRTIMSQISEDTYCAGWLIDLEYHLWAALHDEPGAFPLNEPEKGALRWLSQACGGWIYWDDGLKNEAWIGHEAWAERYAAWRASHPKKVSASSDLGEAVGPGGEGMDLVTLEQIRVQRSPESVDALLRAGASTKGIRSPSGYAEVDELLTSHGTD